MKKHVKDKNKKKSYVVNYKIHFIEDHILMINIHVEVAQVGFFQNLCHLKLEQKWPE